VPLGGIEACPELAGRPHPSRFGAALVRPLGALDRVQARGPRPLLQLTCGTYGERARHPRKQRKNDVVVQGTQGAAVARVPVQAEEILCIRPAGGRSAHMRAQAFCGPNRIATGGSRV
jgi:hypothetical protein